MLSGGGRTRTHEYYISHGRSRAYVKFSVHELVTKEYIFGRNK